MVGHMDFAVIVVAAVGRNTEKKGRRRHILQGADV